MPSMRPLWPIERTVLEITAREFPNSAAVFRRQIESAHVVKFQNSGAGFFSYLAVTDDAALLTEKSPLDGAHGNVLGLEHGMGFVVFLKDGRLNMIEGYCHGDDSTSVDFARVIYGLVPWNPQPDIEA